MLVKDQSQTNLVPSPGIGRNVRMVTDVPVHIVESGRSRNNTARGRPVLPIQPALAHSTAIVSQCLRHQNQLPASEIHLFINCLHGVSPSGRTADCFHSPFRLLNCYHVLLVIARRISID